MEIFSLIGIMDMDLFRVSVSVVDNGFEMVATVKPSNG